jgi:hypothetical protein
LKQPSLLFSDPVFEAIEKAPSLEEMMLFIMLEYLSILAGHTPTD